MQIISLLSGSYFYLNLFFCFKLLLALIHVAHSSPQIFGQSFSSSSFVDSNGQVVSSSIYSDSDGNRIVNGQNINQNSSPSKTVAPVARPQAPVSSSSGSNKDNSGQYVADDRGKWKGN